MNIFLEHYQSIRSGRMGFYRQPRALIAVWGKEAVQFLNGMITNDAAKLEDGAQMSAAFPNVQGRLIALTRVFRNDERFFFETDEVTREKVFQNLFRFTFAGDFFVEDMSGNFEYFETFGNSKVTAPEGTVLFESKQGTDYFVPADKAGEFENSLIASGAVQIPAELYEVLRIENGLPKYGVDMDETTVVLETGLDEAVSFTKGCYIGQEIIARIHFRGHVAKRLTGLILDTAGVSPETGGVGINQELLSPEGKNAGRITSLVMSPGIGKIVALAYVRFEHLTEGTKLKVGEVEGTVKDPPFISREIKEAVIL
jgi:folate-binding protein YgfZ